MQEDNYVVIGSNLFALTLTYYLAREQQDKEINLLLLNKGSIGKRKNIFAYPSIFLLPFTSKEYPLTQSMISRSKELLEEIEINHRNIERKRMRLTLLFSEKDELYGKYLKYLESSSIPYFLPNAKELVTYYSFIKKLKHMKVIELVTQVYFDMKGLWDAYFQEVNELKNVKINTKEFSIKSWSSFRANKIFVTEPSFNLGNDLDYPYFTSVIFQFPVIQHFPSIVLMDVSKRQIIWRDFEGFLWSYNEGILERDSNITKYKNKMLDNIKHSLKVNSLPVLDSVTSKTPSKFIIERIKERIYHIYIPKYLQLILSPLIALEIAKLSKEKPNWGINDIEERLELADTASLN